MDFFIRQNNSLPLLLMKPIHDGRTDYQLFNKMIENAAITFSMMDERGSLIVANKPAFIVARSSLFEEEYDNFYYVGYQFKPEEVKKIGNYKAQFKIDFFQISGQPSYLTGSIVLPQKESLNVYVTNSFVKTEVNYI